MALRRGSHRPISVTCEFGVSPKCRGSWSIPERLALETRARNAGRMICVFCSRATKSTGRANPNCRYPDLDDGFFGEVDSEAKAYLLGWIASDGSVRANGFSFYIHRKDEVTARALRDLICPTLPMRPKKHQLVGFTVNSTAISTDVCRHLGIAPGKKDAVVGFPRLGDDALGWAFLRGVFDGDGSISSLAAALRRSPDGFPNPRCDIASTSPRLLDAIEAFCGVPCYRGGDKLAWSGTNAIDFLGKLYDGAQFSLSRKRDLYLDWCHWVPGLSGGGTHGRHPLFRWLKTMREAVPPAKRHASDSGFDLTLVALAHSHGQVQFYRTGIRVQPAFGWYFDVVPRSSMVRTGHMLANCVGVIDRGYTGEILVPLVKLDPKSPDLPLPARVAQLVPRPIVAAQLIEVEELDETKRGGGGFGSTGR